MGLKKLTESGRLGGSIGSRLIEHSRGSLGGKLTILLLQDIGQPVDVHELHHDLVKQAIEHLTRQNNK